MASVRARFEALSGNVRGAIWMMASTVVFSAMQAAGKYLGDTFHSFELTFFRALFATIAVLPFVMRLGLAGFRTRRHSLHLLRGFFGAAASFCVFYAVTHIPLADATAISFTRPLFMIMVAVFLLGEVVRIRRWTATVIGFGGVLLMIRPGFGGVFDLGALAALGSALFFCLAHVCVKRLATTEDPMTIMIYYSVVSTLMLLPPTLAVWVTPSLTELLILALMGALGALAQTCIVHSLRAGDATVVEPFEYVRLLPAVAWGYMLFGHFPSSWTFLGAAVIILANLYIARRAARERLTAVPGTVPPAVPGPAMSAGDGPAERRPG